MKAELPRRYYEFSKHQKGNIRLRHKGRSCLDDGTTPKRQAVKNIEIHHLLPIWFAREKELDPRIVATEINGVPVKHKEHNQIHEEIRGWDEATQLTYFRAIYQTIMEDIMGDLPHSLKEVRPPLYEIKELPPEYAIYEAVGD